MGAHELGAERADELGHHRLVAQVAGDLGELGEERVDGHRTRRRAALLFQVAGQSDLHAVTSATSISADAPVCARLRTALSFSAPSKRGRTTMLNGLNGLVDVDKGIISREIFVNEEIYRREQDQIFARAWLFIGHESQIPRPGDFLEYVGGYKLYLDLLLDAWDGREGGTEAIGGIHKWLIPCNWKFPAENFSGDRYHGVSHRSVDMVGIGPSGQGRRDMAERNQARWLDVSFPELGHSMIAFLRAHDSPLAPAYQDAPVVAEYFRRCEEERRRRRGEYWRLFGGPGTMFPNTSPLARQPRTLAVWHPRGPHQTEVWRWYFVDADAPAEVKDFLRHYYIRYSGPSGLTEQDDMENWNYAHKASRGTIARQHPYNYEMGLGRSTRAFEDHGLTLPGAITDVTTANASEHNQRGFYRRWRQFMEAASWKDLA